MPPPGRRRGRQPQNPSNFTDAEVKEAWDAISRLNAMVPQLQHFARSVTGNPKVVVKVDPGTPSTRGNVITVRPPLGLGKNPPHYRAECGDRDWRGHQKCPACKLREVIEFYLFHEVGHVAKESHAPCNGTAYDAFEAYLDEWHPAGACDHAIHLRAKVPYGADQMQYASACNEYLPMIVNCLEDARVNEGVYELLPGMRKVFDLNIEKILEEGVDLGVGENDSWKDRPLDAQFMVGFFLIAAHHEVEDRLDDRVVRALGNEEIVAICMQAGVAEDSSRILQLGIEAFRVAQTLGFCLVPKCQVPPPAQPGHPDEDSGAGEQGEGSGTSDSSDRGEGGQPEGDGERSSVPEQDDSGRDDGNSDSGDSSDPEGATSERSGDDPEDAGDSRDDDTDDSDSNGQSGDAEGSGSDDQENSPPTPTEEEDDTSGGDSGTSSTDSRSDDTGDATGSGAGDDDSSDETEADESKQDTGDGSNEEDFDDTSFGSGKSSREDEDDDSDGDGLGGSSMGGSSPSQGDSVGSDDGGLDEARDDEGSRPSGDDDEDEPGDIEDSSGDRAVDSRRDGEDGDDSESEDRETDDHEVDAEDTADDGLDDEAADPWATDGSEGDGRVLQPAMATDTDENLPALGSGTPEDIADAVGRLLMHGNPDDDESEGLLGHLAGEDLVTYIGEKEDEPLSPELEDLLRLAIRQVLFFDNASRYVAGVEVIQWPHGPSEWMPTVPHLDFAPTETLLGQAVLKARSTFDENKRKKHIRNRRSGKINTRVLGRRAPVGDDRIFQKSVLPGRKDYKVVITGDLSGSTDLDGRNEKIKRIMYAQCELLNRLGVPFEAWGHSAYTAPQATMGKSSYYSGSEYYVYMYPIKTENEGWNDLAKTKLANLLPIADNLDGHTLEFCRKRVQASTATDKIIIYFTDGAMPAANYDEEKLVLERETALCKKMGITLLGVGIHTDSPKYYGMNTVRVDSDEDIIKVLEQLEQQLER